MKGCNLQPSTSNLFFPHRIVLFFYAFIQETTDWIDGQVELLVYYNQPSWPHFPFQYLSQTLELADRGSIGQILVNPAP